MKKLIKCTACEREISPRAWKCPNCRESTQHGRVAIALIVLALVGFGLVSMMMEAAKSNVRAAHEALRMSQELNDNVSRWTTETQRARR
jgi:hypothetical protein